MLLYVSALHSFLWLNNIPLHENMYIYTHTHTPLCLFIYQWINWWCFHVLTMDNAAMNIHGQVFVWTYVFIFLEYMARSRMAGTVRLFSKVAAPFNIPTISV